MKIDWKRKLSSRKFWAAVAGWLTSVLTMFGVDDNVGARVIALLSGVGALCAYMLAEGIADGSRAEHGEALPLMEIATDKQEED